MKIKVKKTIKRYIAVMLCVVLTMQNVLTGTADAAGTRNPGIDGEQSFDLLGTPNAAYDKLTLAVGSQVGEDNTVSLSIAGEFSDAYLMDTLGAKIDMGEILDEADWEKDNQGYTGYDDYLNAQKDSVLPSMHFTVKLSLGGDVAFDLGGALEGDIITDANEAEDIKSEKIGQYKLSVSTNGTSPVLRVDFDKKIYDRHNVTFGKKIFASFRENCEAGKEITTTPGVGSNDFKIEVADYGSGGTPDADYSFEKEGKPDTSNPQNIIYTITAGLAGVTLKAASAGQMEASGSSISSRRKSKPKKSTDSEILEADRTLDPDNDEDWETEGSGEYQGPGLLTGLIDALSPEQYGKLNKATNSESRAGDTPALGGKWITDRIPEGLTLVSVEVRIDNSGEYVPLEKKENDEAVGYIIEDGVLKYQIPVSETEVTKQAELRITTRLSDQEYNKYMIAGEAKTWTFVNKAFLKDDDGKANLRSDQEENIIKLSAPFAKEGKPLDSSFRKFGWTLTVNSAFSQGVQLYAVDFIENATYSHNYIQNTVSVGGGEEVAYIKLAQMTDDTYAYDKITSVKVIKGLLEANANIIGENNTLPIVYEYPTGENVSVEGSTENNEPIYNAVMLIPLNDHTNVSDFKITYDTEVTIPPEDLYAGDTPLVLKNHAKILWQWEPGDGPGPGEDFGGADIGKDGEYSCSLVDKLTETNAYDKSENTINWKFEINQLGQAVNELIIEDVFDNSKQILWDLKANASGVWPTINLVPVVAELGKRDLAIPYSATVPDSGDYYTVGTTVSGEEKLTIVLRNLTDKERYSFYVKTFVTDATLTSDTSKVSITNKATVTVKKDSDIKTFTPEASCQVENTLIRKEAINVDNGEKYDYTNNTVKWRITINPYYWKIADAKITDDLPNSSLGGSDAKTGTHFSALTSATMQAKGQALQNLTMTSQVVNDSAYTALDSCAVNAWTVDIPINGDIAARKILVKQISAEQFTFDFLNTDGTKVDGANATINESFTFEFTTHVTDTWRKEEFKSNKQSAALVNKATLAGKVKHGDSTIPITASDTATNNVSPAPMMKSGTYFKKQKVTVNNGEEETNAYGVDWCLYVNRTNANISGAILTDTIAPCMELLTSTMKISVVTLDSKGQPVAGSEKEIYPPPAEETPEIPSDALTLTPEEFTLTIPELYKTSTLKFEFRTVMVDDAYSSEITNNVSIKGDGWSDDTGNANGSNNNDFWLKDYATASKLTFIKIYKQSTNAKPSYALKDAEFKIYEMKPPESSEQSINSWIDANTGEFPTLVKTKKTNAKGSLNFMFLKPDTMYKIEESKSPDGYKPSTLVWYVVPKLSAGTGNMFPPNETNAEKSYDVFVNEVGKKYVEKTILNTPLEHATDTGELKFKKTGQNGQALPGVNFKISHQNFKDRIVKGDLATGEVKIENLDASPSRYTITENAPNGYLKGKPLYAKASLATDGGAVTVKFTTPLDESFVEVEGVYTLKNTPITQSGAFTKVDQNGFPLASDQSVMFEVKRRGDGGNLLTIASETDPSKIQICLDVDSDTRMASNITGGSGSGTQSKDTYYDYRLNPSITSSTVKEVNGVISLENLLYGDYMLTETTFPSQAASNEAATIYIRVNGNGIFASTTEFTHDTEGTALKNYNVPAENIASPADPKKVTVANQMKYGHVQINKVLGDYSDSGTVEAITKGDQKVLIPNVKFKIYRNTGTAVLPVKEEPAFLTLKTEAIPGVADPDARTFSGFKIDTDGFYTDADKPTIKRQLVVGNYILEEQPSSDYEVPASYPFEIAANTVSGTFSPTTTYIGWNGQNYTSSSVEAAGKAMLFLNVPKHGTIALTKKDGSKNGEVEYNTSATLDGAEFQVWTKGLSGGDKYVADLNCASSSTTYKLAQPTAGSGATATDTDGKKYLIQESADGEWKLLYGSYQIKETKAHSENYILPTDAAATVATVTIKDGDLSAVDNTVNVKPTVKNEIITQKVEIQKLVERRKAASENTLETVFDKYENAEAGFEFTLTGKNDSINAAHQGPVNLPPNATFTQTATTTSSSGGKAVFEKVPVGTYSLKETEIPSKYGTKATPFIKLMPEVLVTVTNSGVSYTFKNKPTEASDTTIPTTPEPEAEAETGTMTVSVDNSSEGVKKLTVRNNCELGSASGIKVGVKTIGDSSTAASMTPLVGVTFTLTNTDNDLFMTLNSDSDGKITVTQIPYGSYNLTEDPSTTPNGYQPAQPITFTVNSATDHKITSTGATSGYIENLLIQKSLKFAKVDQNGDKLGSGRTDKILFTIARDADSPTIAGLPSFAYPESSSIKPDADGYVQISNLPYGKYTVTETKVTGDSLLPNNKDVSFKVTIEKDTDANKVGNTKVTLTPVDPSFPAPLSQSKPSENSADNDMYDFTSSFKLPNEINTGQIVISKKLGEQTGTSITAGTLPLKAIQFNIYRQIDGGREASPFISLQTNESGSFVKNADGTYGTGVGKKILVAGTYYLEEVFPADSVYRTIVEAGKYTQFTVANGQMTRIEYAGSGTPAVSSAADIPFLNVPKRGTITVNKIDSDAQSVKVSGAEFGVYTAQSCSADSQVAKLTEKPSNAGTYILNGTGFSKSKTVGENEIPYLYEDTTTSTWKILAGTYYVKEQTPPAGYSLSTTVTEITVADERDGTENTGNAKSITNALAKVDLKFLKVDQNGDPIKSDGTNRKLTFKVERINSGSTASSLDTRAAALLPSDGFFYNSVDGTVTLTNLIYGKYKVTEQAADWITGTPVERYITVEQTEDYTPKVRLSRTETGTENFVNSAAQASGNPLCDFTVGEAAFVKSSMVENQLKYAFIDIKKVVAVDDGTDSNTLSPQPDKPLEGVVFHVYKDVDGDGSYTDADAATPFLELVTGTDGRFKKNADAQYLKEDGTPQTKRLVYDGKYLLYEYKLPEGLRDTHSADPNYYAFTIGKSGSGNTSDTLNSDGKLNIYYIGTSATIGFTAPDSMSAPVFGSSGEALVFPNGPTRYIPVELIKTDAETTDKVAGAQFKVYTGTGIPVADLTEGNVGEYTLSPGVDNMGENASGQKYLKKDGNVNELLTGSYYIRETKAPAGYERPQTYWYFTIAPNASAGAVIENKDLKAAADSGAAIKPFTNTLGKQDVIVDKWVEDLVSNTFHQSGQLDDTFTFLLEGKPINSAVPLKIQKTVEHIGQNAGRAVFNDVPAGEYTLTEIMTGPAGQGGTLVDVYTAPKQIEVRINENGAFYNGSTTAATQIRVDNTLKRGKVTGNKFTEDASGNVPLANAEFELKPINPARVGILSAKSDSNGKFVFNDVPLGTYELRENKTPDANHYKDEDKIITVNVTAENQNVTTGVEGGGAAQPIEFMNDAFSTLTLKKLAQVIDGNQIADIGGVMHPGQGFVFKITGDSLRGEAIQSFITKENIEGASVVNIAADGVYVTTGATGTVKLKTLPVGSYKVQEQVNEKNNDTGSYVPDIREMAADISINHSTGVVSAPELTIENRLKRSQIQGLKTTADKTTPLEGAVIGLFPTGTTSFTEENLWCGQKITTGADGIYLFPNLPYGTYLIAEVTAPSGYNLNTTTKYEVTVAAETVKTTGFLLEGTQPKAETETPILIANTKKSSGGGGGGGGGGSSDRPKPSEPTGPGPGTETTPPGETNPGVPNPGEPQPPIPTAPAESNPGGGTDVVLPPETPPGTDVEVMGPDGEVIYRGQTDANGRVNVDLPPGTYTIVMFDENQVPLGTMTFTIEDPFTPLGMLAAPDAGDHSIPIVVLAVLMMISLSGIILISRRKKQDKHSSGKEQ